MSVLVITTLAVVVVAWEGPVSSSGPADVPIRDRILPTKVAVIDPLPTPEPPDVMAFGVDVASVDEQRRLGIGPDYASIWIGAWTEEYGWNTQDAQLSALREAGVTPVIHLYYWGDDISRACFEDGCWSSLHGAHKDQEGWRAVTQALIEHLDERMAGTPVMVVLETEFNKADMADYEPFDEALADTARTIREGYPPAEIVLGLGNWNRDAWGTWDRAAAASDAIGLQAVHATRPGGDYQDFLPRVLEGARLANETFGLPVVVHDIAFSSADGLEDAQADGLATFFRRMDELHDAGVEALFYRSWEDTPEMDVENAFGYAERHWGLATADGTRKPAADVWIAGVLTERTVGSFAATFDVSDGSNDWWVEVAVDATHPVVEVEAVIDGVVRPLHRTAWGTWASSFYIEAGTDVRFVARNLVEDTAYSGATRW